MSENQRKHERINSLNLLHLYIKENEEVIRLGMGRTLNISESGIRLETNFSIDSKKTILLTIGIEDDILELKGQISYYIARDKKYEFGIQFMDLDDKSRVLLKEYIKIFKEESAK